MTGYSTLCVILFSLLITNTFAQSTDFDISVDHFDTTLLLDKDLDSLFTVEYRHYYKVVTNRAVNQKYALVCCEQDTSRNSDFGQYDAVINIPVKTVGVDGAFPVLAFLELLGVEDTVKFISGYENATSPCYANVTAQEGESDVVFVPSDTYHSAKNVITFSANDNQLTPLEEKEAMATFSIIRDHYNCHQINLSKTPQRPALAWTSYQHGEWRMYNERYFQQLAKDAGLTLVTPSIPMKFHQDIHNAQLVIDQTDFSRELTTTDATYEDWLNAGAFDAGTVRFDQPFIHRNALYRVDGLVDEKGFLDYTQRAAARPDLMLLDMIHLGYPLYDRSYQYVWLRNFARMDRPRVISPTTYKCSSSIALSNTCNIRNDLFEDNSTSFRHGSNVGIILGILASCSLAVGGIVFYRNRKRQAKVEYFPLNHF